jgi:uncharacterized protein (TIGR02145 family)
MARNLNYAVSGSKCGDGGGSLSNVNTSTCNTYGRLYNWATAMALPSSCNSTSCSSRINAKHLGICPSGWHLPSDAEWSTLTSYVGSNAGTKLKAKSGWNGGGNGTDEFGFSALPGGVGTSDGLVNVGGYGSWWSASEVEGEVEGSSGGACIRNMYYHNEYADYNISSKDYLSSVRCLQD